MPDLQDEEESWTPWNPPSPTETGLRLGTPPFPPYMKHHSTPVIVDDGGCLPPDQLHPSEDGFAFDSRVSHQHGRQPDDVIEEMPKTWPAGLVNLQAQDPQTILILPQDGDESPGTFHTSDFSLAHHRLPSCGEYPGSIVGLQPFHHLPSGTLSPTAAHIKNGHYHYVCEAELLANDLSSRVGRYYSHPSSRMSPDEESPLEHNPYHSWQDRSPEGSLPDLSQTDQVNSVGDVNEDRDCSFPPPQDHQINNRTSPKSGSHVPAPFRSNSTARKRRNRAATGDAESPVKTVALQIVQEDGLGGSISPSACIPAIARARRNGPLSLDGRRDAALRRKDKSVCVWCRLAKKKCSGDSPCTTCMEQAKTMVFAQPCVKADFFQIVESGTCNYISQRAVNHPTLDGSTRVRMELPARFEMKELLSLLDERREKFNIRASQAWGSLYVLDLNETYNFLKELNRTDDNAQYDLCEFIDHRILKFNKWLRCIKDCDPMQNSFALLSQWNNMPSRASYAFVPLDGGNQDRPMNVQDPKDRREILLAAQLSRIFCRKLEVDGYRALQNVLNKNKWDEVPHDSFIKFVSQLGQILLTLRWRVSWWELLGDSGAKPDINKERYEERVRSLCRILYFYYTSVRLKLPAWLTPTELDGVWSKYADAETVWDDFPSVATLDGFNRWLERGKTLIRDAGVQSRIAKF